MTTSKKYSALFITLSSLVGCASGPTALEQALAISADTTSSISVNELLDRAIIQGSKSAVLTKTAELSKDQQFTLPMALPTGETLHSPPTKPTAKPSLMLTFISDRSELTSRHQQQLRKFTQRHTPAGRRNNRQLLKVKISCAPSAQTNPYVAASTAMSRCMNVSRFLEQTTANPAISLAPNLPLNHIQISQ